MISFEQKFTRFPDRKENMIHISEKCRQWQLLLKETRCHIKKLQSSHYKYVKELKKRMFKGVKEGMMIMFHQTGNINNETKIILKGKVKLLKLKSRVSEIKNSLEGLNNRFQLSEERISRLEDRAIEIM